MTKRVVVASNNSGKLRELQVLLKPIAASAVPQGDLGIAEAEETGLCFVENAILKARNASVHAGLPAIADDSGIAVDALGGAPGVRSARYAGVGASDEANLDRLLLDMRDVPDGRRGARFICVIVYLRHAEDPVPIICQGEWPGELLFARRGQHGFGYDPIFQVPTHGCSSAELDPDEKNRISHRGQALRQLITALAAHGLP